MAAHRVPAEPRAWLTLTARRRAIDLMRRDAARHGKEAGALFLVGPTPPDPSSGFDLDAPELPDDLLRLVFTCCHPSLAVESQVALALRTLGGLTTAEVGRALLVGEATMTKRLVRAKQKIARAAVPYRVPDAHGLPARLRGVVSVCHLLFNEGCSPAGAPRPALVDEAVRLTRLLLALMPGEPSVIGLLALELLQDSRRDARHDIAGRPVLLVDQDRGRWRRELVEEGVLLVGEGPAPVTRSARPLRRPGGDRSVPRARSDLDRHRLDGGALLVRRAADGDRHPGRAAQPRGGGR